MSSSEHMREPVPIAVFSGFLGSGKTTILQRVIPTLEAKGEKVCVIVNDLSMDNIDVFAFNAGGDKENAEEHRDYSDCVENIITTTTNTKNTNVHNSSVNDDKISVEKNYSEETMSTMPIDNKEYSNPCVDMDTHQKNEILGVKALSGGCICCNLLSELVCELLKIYNEGKYTYIFIECTGVADTTPLITTLASLPLLHNKIKIDVVCTVLHAPTLLNVTTQKVCNTECRQEKEQHCVEYIVDVNSLNIMCRRQMSGANVILINNWEHLLSSDKNFSTNLLEAWETAILTFVKESNNHARVFFTNNGYIAFDELLYREHCFDLDGSLLYFLQTYAAMNQSLDSLEDKLLKKAKKSKKFLELLPPSEKEGENVVHSSVNANHNNNDDEKNNSDSSVVINELRSNNDNDDDGDDEEDEEAFELRLLGIQTITFCSSSLIVSTKALCQNLSTERGVHVMHDIIRSKGFFDAVDDINADDSSNGCSSSIINAIDSINIVKTNCNSNDNDKTSNDAQSSINKRVIQFRWQSVNNHFDYGPVLPPYVTLQVAAKEQKEANSVCINTEVLDVLEERSNKQSCTAQLRCKIVFIGTFSDAEKKREELEEFFKLCAP